MEIVNSPLNLAHQQCRRADHFLVSGKYQEAISCHRKAAELLMDAMKTTDCKQACLSMELQRDSHMKQQRLLQERLKRDTDREATKAQPSPVLQSSCPATQTHPQCLEQPLPLSDTCPSALECERLMEREYDTLLYQLQTRQTGRCQPAMTCPGSKTTKDDKVRLEEQQTTIKDLRRLVDHLMNENQRLTQENKQLQLQNIQLQSEAADFVERSELWVLPQGGSTIGTGGSLGKKNTGKAKEIAIPQLPPLEMPAQEDLCLDDLPPLELPEDIHNELQELLEKDKL